MERSFLVEGDRFSIKHINTSNDKPAKPEKFYFVDVAKPSKYTFKWTKDIVINSEDGPQNIDKLKPGRTDVFYQVIFGIRPNAWIYINIPADTRLAGIAEESIARTGFREIGAITQDMSPFKSPDFVTEMILQKDTSYEFPALFGYNPTNKPIRPEIEFRVNKIEPVEITDQETIDMMKKKRLTYRPLTLGWKER